MTRLVSSLRWLVSKILFFLSAVIIEGYAVAEEPPTNGKWPTFEQHIAPILKTYCFKCHSGQQSKAGLDLRRRFAILRGGDNGPAIVAGKPDQSLLIEMIEDGQMPPDGEPDLNEDQINALRKWIASGAPIDGKEEKPLEDADGSADLFSAESRQHWAFQPVEKITLPPVSKATWLATSVDAFILAAHEPRSWQPAPPADRSELIRRVYFNLLGLPPAPDEVVAFENELSPDALARVVDRLLNSPRYGERWAQHWLDVVRFAETEGFEYDRHLPDAWRYRDYVIDSLNDDKPFDTFVMEQLAGDEIAPNDQQCQTASIFHRLGAVRRNAGNPDIALSRNEVLTERTNIVGEAFLGLTIGCARCHNHKLEPILQKDYYRLQAYFAATQEHNISLVPDKDWQAWEKKTENIKRKIAGLKERVGESNGDEKARLEKKISDLEYQIPPHLPTIPGIRNEFDQRTAVHVLRRGVWEHKGVPVGPRPLSVLVSNELAELPADEREPRTHLAGWIVDPQHPLTARVIVNRLWQHHFGIGLVQTANDFGTHGDPPSNARLLDWLAMTLVENGWQLKPIHRMIVLSNTYQQSTDSPFAAEYANSDPENRLLWRFTRRRLAAEEIRDAMLSISGRINLKAGGASVMVPVDEDLVNLLYKPSQWEVTQNEAEHYRRSIYLIAKRNLRLPFMEAFDAPALQTSCPRRESSTHAPQTLEMLNGRFANEMAAALAMRLADECGERREVIVERAFWLAVGRAPTNLERALSLDFLREHPLSAFALAVFNLNGFVYVQ